MPQLSLALLGSVTVQYDGRPIPAFRSNKALALLIYLAAERRRPHSREHLMTLLWPGMPEPSARQNLRQTLYLLRQAIPEVDDKQGTASAFILADRQTVQLNPAARYELDVTRFSELVGSDPSRAIELYRGEFLSDFYLPDSNAFEEWAAAKRALYRVQVLAALSALTTRHLKRGEYEAAKGKAQRQLEMDGLRESAHRQSMEALALSGHRRQALAQYETCRNLLAEELGIVPSVETMQLAEAIRAGELDKEPARRLEEATGRKPEVETIDVRIRHNLPAQATPFIGRERELTELEALLANPDVRLITIVAAGGMGKTRLALALAERLVELDGHEGHPYPHGVLFVSLAALEEADQIPEALADALNLRLGGDDRGRPSTQIRPPEQQVLDFMRRRRLLIIVDNFEHLLAGAGLLSRILQTARKVQILVTSRERLHLSEEQLYPLQGLDFPDWESPPVTRRDEEAAEFAAVKLFLQTARRVQPHFEVAAAERAHLIHICRLTAGMPLALELAAGWIDMLSLVDIAAEIEAGLDLLETDARNVPERQRSMRVLFDVSWRRLSEDERKVFREMTVFRGGFTRQAAREVVRTGDGSAPSLRLLAGLVDKSFLGYDWAKDRYQIHPMLRQYGAGKLTEKPEEEVAVRDRHTGYYCRLLEQKRDSLSYWIADIPRELDVENVGTALNWAIGRKQVVQLGQAIEGLGWLYIMHHRYRDAEETCQRMVEHLTPEISQSPANIHSPIVRIDATPAEASLIVKALAWRAYFNMILGQVDLARQLLQQSKEVLDSPILSGQDIRREKAVVLRMMGVLLRQLGKREEAIEKIEQSLALLQSLGDRVGALHTLFMLCEFSIWGGKLEKGKTWMEEALALSRSWGKRDAEAVALRYLGLVQRRSGEFDMARRTYAESLTLARQQDVQQIIGEILMEQAYFLLGLGEFNGGADLLQQAGAHFHEPGGVASYLLELGPAYWHAGRFDQAIETMEDSLSTAKDSGSVDWLTKTITYAGHLHAHLGRYEESRAHSVQALFNVEKRSNHWILGWAHGALGWIDLIEGDYVVAHRSLRESVIAFRALKDLEYEAWSLAMLALATWGLGDDMGAEQQLGTALQRAKEVKGFIPLMFVLPNICLWLEKHDQPERARVLWAQVARHPFIGRSRLIHDLVGRHIPVEVEPLDPDTVTPESERGMIQEFWELADRILADELLTDVMRDA